MRDLDERDDAAIVLGLRGRDEMAMRTLYARYSDRIFRFLSRLTGDRHVADDLHQDTWLAAARHAANLRPESDLAAWLFTIARNRYRSWCRWSILSRASGTPVDGQERSAPASPGSSYDLERALARLTPPLREVLLLVGCEGMEASQVATVLGITPNAVRQRVSRARAAVRQAMNTDDLAQARTRLKRAR
jgi:RNA polymerase sigma-70 factor (ECF subfamily)